MRTIAREPIAAFPTTTLTPLTTLRRAASTLMTRRTIFAPRLPLPLRTLTLRPALRLGGRLFRRFGRRRLDRHCFRSSRRCRSFGRRWLLRRRLRR